MGVLAAGFVDGAGREGPDVAEGEAVVSVVEAGGGGGGAEGAGSAGVAAVDVVEREAGGELVFGVELVVEFGEGVGGCFHRVGIEAGEEAGAGAAGGIEAGIEGVDVGGGDGDESGLLEGAVFEVGEVEGAVAQEGAAEGGSVLGLGGGEFGLTARWRR